MKVTKPCTADDVAEFPRFRLFPCGPHLKQAADDVAAWIAGTPTYTGSALR